MFTAVIFDRDGVLTDFDVPAATAYFRELLPVSIEELSIRWQQWGQAAGFPRSLAEEQRFWQGFWQQVSDDLNLSPPVRTQLHRLDYKLFLQPFPDAHGALLATRQRGLKTGVLSNFNLASLADSLTAVGLAGLVDAACAAPVIGVSKPHPEAYLTITRTLEVLPEQCLFFDDEPACVAGARHLGMIAFLVDRQQPRHDIAAGVVCDLTALPTILNQTITGLKT